MTVSLVVAIAENNVIGRHGAQLPWRLKADLRHFRNITMGHTIVMGRTTYETIGKPLPGRTNVVISRQLDFKAEGCTVVHSLERALELPHQDELFVIGGATVYEQALPVATKMYLTRVHTAAIGEVEFTFDEAEWDVVSTQSHDADKENEFPYSFVVLQRRDHAA